MRHRNGAACGNLLLKQRDDTAATAQNIAESHSSKNGFRSTGIVLHDHLAHSLGGTHDAGRVNGLIGGNKNESPNIMLVSSPNNVQRAKHVVLNGFAWTNLHKRNMLVRCRMKHNRGAVLPENLLDAGNVAYASDFHYNVHVVVLGEKLLTQHVRIVFIHIKYNNTSRRQNGKLTAQFATDRTAAARNQNGLASNIARSNAVIEHDFLPAKEVSHIDIAQRNVAKLVNSQISDIRKRFQYAICLRANGINSLALFCGRGGNSYDYLLYVVLLNQRNNVITCSSNLDTVDTQAHLCRIVVCSHHGNSQHIGIFVRHPING